MDLYRCGACCWSVCESALITLSIPVHSHPFSFSPAGGALSFQFSVDDSSLQRLQKDWQALLVEQCDMDRLGQVLAMIRNDPDTLSLPDTDSELPRSRSNSLQSKPAGAIPPRGSTSQGKVLSDRSYDTCV